jgi:hypothetical protein
MKENLFYFTKILLFQLFINSALSFQCLLVMNQPTLGYSRGLLPSYFNFGHQIWNWQISNHCWSQVHKASYSGTKNMVANVSVSVSTLEMSST